MSVLADRSEAGSRFFTGVHAPSDVLALRRLAITLSAVLTVLFAVCLAVVWRAVRQAKANAKSRRTLRELLGQVIVSLVTCAYALTLLSLDGRWQGCAIVGSFGGTLYVLQHFFCYRVLAIRALSVQNAMPEWYATLLNIVWYVIYSFWGLAVLALLNFSGKLMYVEEFCIVHLNRLLPIMAVIGDSILSSTLLFLFVWPVLRHSSEVRNGRNDQNSEEARVLHKLVRENLLLSSIPIITTMMLMVVLAGTTRAESYSESSTDFIPYMELMGGLSDEFVNTCSTFVMFRKLLFSAQKNGRRLVKPIISLSPLSTGRKPAKPSEISSAH